MEAANLDTSCPSWDDKTILLVDDQIDVLITIKIMLQTCGYAVNAFNDPLLALDHFRRHSHDYGIVISDMILPSMHPVGFPGVMGMRRNRLRWPIWPTAQLANFIARFRAPLRVVVMKI